MAYNSDAKMRTIMFFGGGPRKEPASGGGGGGYEGPLDLVPGAVVAYSQRAMAAAYVSNAVRIRRDSDDAEQNFTTATGNAVVVADVSSFIGAGSGFAKTWFDQSGNSNDATQATTNKQPIWVSSVSNSKPGLDFNSPTKSFFGTGSNVTFSGAGFTAFLVFKDIGNSGQGIAGMNAVQQDANALQIGYNINNFIFLATDDGVNYIQGNSDTVAIDSGAHVIDLGFDNDSGSLKVDGTNFSLSFDFTDAVGTIANLLGVGCDTSNGEVGSSFWEAKMCELIIYGTLLSDQDRTSVRQNIATYYGITLP